MTSSNSIYVQMNTVVCVLALMLNCYELIE